MTERPILFSGPMVRAILAGRKTQTRRVVKPQPDFVTDDGVPARFTANDQQLGRLGEVIPCPYVHGDRLWVKETYAIVGVDGCNVNIARAERMPAGKTLADTDGGLELFHVEPDIAKWAAKRVDYERWKPSIFMPRWASRLTLEVVNVRVERLNQISERDAMAEGITDPLCVEVATLATGGATYSYAAAFRLLWDSINAKRAPWASNPFVRVIEFRPATPGEQA